MFINPRTESMVSVLSFYKYNDKLFDKWTVPTGIDKDLAVNLILQETANLESFYTNWEYLNFAIGVWGKEMFWTFNKLYESTQFDYNPIWNKDGVIREERKVDETTTNENMHTGTSRGESESAGSRSDYGNIAESTENSQAGTNTAVSETETETTNGIAGFNSTLFVDDTKQDGNSNGSSSGTDTSTETGSKTAISRNTATDNSKNVNKEIETQTDNESGTRGVNEKYERIEQGNIGLTSTQQLIEEERRVAMFDLYRFIVDSFKRNFCIMVY